VQTAQIRSIVKKERKPEEQMCDPPRAAEMDKWCFPPESAWEMAVFISYSH
jgi:hypothetical protein